MGLRLWRDCHWAWLLVNKLGQPTMAVELASRLCGWKGAMLYFGVGETEVECGGFRHMGCCEGERVMEGGLRCLGLCFLLWFSAWLLSFTWGKIACGLGAFAVIEWCCALPLVHSAGMVVFECGGLRFVWFFWGACHTIFGYGKQRRNVCYGGVGLGRKGAGPTVHGGGTSHILTALQREPPCMYSFGATIGWSDSGGRELVC